MGRYRALRNSLLVPRLDENGKATNKNVLVRFGKVEQLSDVDAQQFVVAGLLAEATTGSPVAVSEPPEVEQQEATPRPARNATLDELRAYCTVQGIEFTEKDTKADLQTKIDKAQAE